MLAIGGVAPDFSAETTDGTKLRLSDLRGRVVVIYFFPRAFTPGCTIETNRFRDNYPEISALGAQVVGISPDEFERQCRFAEARQVAFPLVSDATKEIARSYDVQSSILARNKRVTYIIDEQGVVQAIFHHEWQVSRHLDDVLAFLKKRKAGQASADHA